MEEVVNAMNYEDFIKEYNQQVLHQRIIKDYTMPTEKEITMTRRFYKSKSAVNAPHILKLYNEAVADAKDYVIAGHDEVYIVEVVAIVKRTEPEPPPISVISVRKS